MSSGWVSQCNFDKISEEICVWPLAYRVERKSSFFVCLVFFYSWSNRWRTFHSLVKKKPGRVLDVCKTLQMETLKPFCLHGLRNHSVRTLYSNTFNATKKSSALHTLGAVSINRGGKRNNTYLQLLKDWFKQNLLSSSIFTVEVQHIAILTQLCAVLFFVISHMLMQNIPLEKTSDDTI